MAKLQNKSKSASTRKSSSAGSTFLRTLSGILGLVVVLIGAAFSIIGGGNGSPTVTTLPGTNIATVATPRPGTVATPVPTTGAGRVQTVSIPKGFGAKKNFWEVYFTAPLNTTNRNEFVGGTDTVVASVINAAQRTLDIAAFEWDNEVINDALLEAIDRGVTVRMVADNEHTIEDDGSLMADIEAAGVPIVYDNRSDLMHDKFMIVDSATIVTGSTNWTMNGVYRNYNNLLVLRNLPQAVQFYQSEFNDMFSKKVFGSKKTGGKTIAFTAPGNIPMEIYFAPKDDVIGKINAYVLGAKTTIRFMAFSFTQDSLGAAMLKAAQGGVTVQGIFEKTGSNTTFSEMKNLFCAGLDVRQDTYGGVMHHKVIIIDNQIVIAGSFNFSDNAVKGNDENLVIIKDADLAAQFLAEFDRVQKVSAAPTGVAC